MTSSESLPQPAQIDSRGRQKKLGSFFILANHGKEFAVLEREVSGLRHDVSHDDLTGLLNRRGLAEALKDFAESGKKPLVIVSDLVNLKGLNDKHPDKHAAGDRFLKYAANILRDSVRPDTIVARTGGDEFVIILDANENRDEYHDGHEPKQLTPEEKAEKIRGRINENMGQLLIDTDLDGYDVHISTGAGIADTYEEAQHLAEYAMYRHKQELHDTLGSYR
jgi:diguanylate cyclase (GGDEF)-like protein